MYKRLNNTDIFILPVLNNYLILSPVRKIQLLVNKNFVHQLKEIITSNASIPKNQDQIIKELITPVI